MFEFNITPTVGGGKSLVYGPVEIRLQSNWGDRLKQLEQLNAVVEKEMELCQKFCTKQTVGGVLRAIVGCSACGKDHKVTTTVDDSGEWFLCENIRVDVTLEPSHAGAWR